MNLDSKPFQHPIMSFQNNDLQLQKSSEIHKHKVNKGYQILSKNDFGKVKKRINLGIFNKKTNFLI